MVVENDDYHQENEIFLPIVMIVTTTIIVMNEFDHSILKLLKQQRIRPEKFRPERGFQPDLCDGSAVLHQLSYQINWG